MAVIQDHPYFRKLEKSSKWGKLIIFMCCVYKKKYNSLLLDICPCNNGTKTKETAF